MTNQLGRGGLAAVALLVGLSLWFRLAAYSDGPPVGSTGGFQENTCHHCHFDQPLNQEDGALELQFPEAYVPAAEYTVCVKLQHRRLKAAGFQLTTRFEESGLQAGRLLAVDESAETVSDESARIQYIQHTRSGTEPDREGGMIWQFSWTAPADSRQPVVVHLAANAANGDDSEFGDFIYLLEKKVTAEAGIALAR